MCYVNCWIGQYLTSCIAHLGAPSTHLIEWLSQGLYNLQQSEWNSNTWGELNMKYVIYKLNLIQYDEIEWNIMKYRFAFLFHGSFVLHSSLLLVRLQKRIWRTRGCRRYSCSSRSSKVLSRRWGGYGWSSHGKWIQCPWLSPPTVGLYHLCSWFI